MASNRLMLNPTKSDFTWCASPHRAHLIDRPAFTLREGTVTASSTVRNLGAYFDEILSMSKHADQLAHSCYYQRRGIGYIRRSLTTTAVIHLVNAFIIARVDYCNSILLRTTQMPTQPYSICHKRCGANRLIVHVSTALNPSQATAAATDVFSTALNPSQATAAATDVFSFIRHCMDMIETWSTLDLRHREQSWLTCWSFM